MSRSHIFSSRTALVFALVMFSCSKGAEEDPDDTPETQQDVQPQQVQQPDSTGADTSDQQQDAGDQESEGQGGVPGQFDIIEPLGIGNDPAPAITWSASSGATHYTVIVATDPDCLDAIQLNMDVTATSIETGFDLEGTYYFCIIAHNEEGQTRVQSDPQTYVLDITPPDGPSTFTASSSTRLGGYKVSVHGLPEDRSDITSIEIHTSDDAMPEDCFSESSSHWKFAANMNENFSLEVQGTPGSPAYARLCLFDAAGNVNDVQTASTTASSNHRAFISSVKFDGNLISDYMNINGGEPFDTGLQGADARCQYLADEANLKGTWKAILSDDLANTSNRLTILGAVWNNNHVTIPQKVAANSSAFWAAATTDLAASIIYTETGAYLDEVSYLERRAWTGSNSDGTAEAANCSNWSSASGNGHTGDPVFKNQSWLDMGTLGCSTPLRLYCIEQN